MNNTNEKLLQTLKETAMWLEYVLNEPNYSRQRANLALQRAHKLLNEVKDG